MAEASYGRDPRPASQHAGRSCFSLKELDRYSNALQTFLIESAALVERQRTLETELDVCKERLRGFIEESVDGNILSSNRLSSVEAEYMNFYDHHRMDAIDCISDLRVKKENSKWIEIEDQRIACMVFEEAFKAAHTLKGNFLEGISCMIKSAPAIGAKYSEAKSDAVIFSVKRDQRQSSPLGQSDMNKLKAILKETAISCDVDAVIKKAYDSLSQHQEKGIFSAYQKDLFDARLMKIYLRWCCKYAWKMVCQTPPYFIQGNSFLHESDPAFDPNIHKVSARFSQHKSGYIRLVLWPGLFEGSSGRVIRKTEVVLK